MFVVESSQMTWTTLRANSHGVPRPTRVSKSQHEGKLPTFEPREITKTWLFIINSWMLIFLQK